MSKKAFLVICVAVLLLGTAVTIGCAKSKEGEIPTLRIGNSWTYEFSSQDVYYTSTEEVIGEGTVDGKDCWVIKESETPAYGGIDSMTIRRDKSNLLIIQRQGSGTLMGVPFTLAETRSYLFDIPFYPLELGNTVKAVETDKRTTTYLGQTQVEPKTTTTVYKVEQVEEITVPAGTFKCFKIVEYDESGVKLWTGWHSDKVKMFVKEISEDSGVVWELKSYSL